MNSNVIKKLLPHVISIGAFVLLSAVFFLPQFQGKGLVQGDIVSFKGMFEESKQVENETGVRPLWTNSMFGGMPTYQMGATKKGNLLASVSKVASFGIPRPAGYFLLAMICSYILLISLGVSPLIAAFGSICYSISTYHLNVYEAGHTSKMYTLLFSSLIISGVVLTLRKNWIAGFIIYTTGMGLSFLAGHYQMTYYLFIVLLVLGVVEVIHAIKAKTLPDIGKALGLFVLGAILALGASAATMWTTYEYAKDTMRGEPILESASTQVASSSNVKGLEWQYAMNWSNGWLDLAATVIPGVVGGSTAEKLGPKSETYQAFKQGGVPMQRSDNKYQTPMYWGSLPFTSGPAYVGIVFAFFFILGLFIIKSRMKWWMGIGVLLIYLLSLGKNFELLNSLFFEYFPLYNKFRAPSSILGITGLLIPVFGVYTISEILKSKYTWPEIKKPFMITSALFGAFCLFFAVLGTSMFDFNGLSDGRYQNAALVDLFIADRKSLMSSDAWRCLFLVAISATAIWAYLNKRAKYSLVLGVLIVVSVFDLWSVGKRYLDWADFTTKKGSTELYKPRAVDTQILNQEKNRGMYRVYDTSISTFNSSQTSYYHNTIGGYHAAKLQRYQDIIDRHISRNNIAVLNMLNTKYVITQDGKLSVNPDASGPAWFVNEVSLVNTPNEEIDALTNFNPVQTAIINNEFSDMVDGVTLSKNGSIELDTYFPNNLTYKTNSNSDQIAVFSEVWYGPDKGWQAYIDGEAVDHFRANYVLRGLVVPAGEHTVEFVFDPAKFKQGTVISYVSSILIILMLLGGIFVGGKKKLEEWKVEPVAPEVKRERVKKTVKKRKGGKA